MRSDKIKVISLEETCLACPSQWEGQTSDGKFLYIRYRWGSLSVSLNQKKIFEKQIGDPLDGVMSFEELEVHTKKILDFKEVKFK